MDKEKIRKILLNNGYEIVLEKRYKDYAYRLVLSTNDSVFCGDKNAIWIKGKNKTELEKLIDNKYNNEPNKKVFIVHGKDEAAKKQLLTLLSKWGLEPYILEEMPGQSDTIIEMLENYIPQANYGIVLATPDDIGYRCGEEYEKKFRARQNVILELGILIGKLNRKKVAILIKKTNDFELPSDISGIRYLSYQDSVLEVSKKLAKELNQQGYNVTSTLEETKK